MTGLSSLPRPRAWAGEWVHLPRDDDADEPRDPTARGQLHWVPAGDAGLRSRMAAISRWVAERHPAAVVCDVSVEVALLCRLHGVPVVSVVLPGDRGDTAHRLGHGASDLLVGFWPPQATGIVRGLTPADDQRLLRLGALSRHPVADPVPARLDGVRRVVVLGGRGGGGIGATDLARARAQTPQWSWQVLGGPCGEWVADPRPALLGADVVLTHAGENAVAETAAARRPAVIVPQGRPHGEQASTARVLGAGPWPALVVDDPSGPDWSSVLTAAQSLDGAAWGSWCDGGSAARFAAALDRLLGAGLGQAS